MRRIKQSYIADKVNAILASASGIEWEIAEDIQRILSCQHDGEIAPIEVLDWDENCTDILGWVCQDCGAELDIEDGQEMPDEMPF